jgi:ATP-dependent RNA helicase DDX35
MLLTSGEYGCAEEVASISALLQVESVFQTPFGQAAPRARMAKRKFEVAEGDLLTLLNVYSAFVESGKTKHFCNQNYLHFKRLKRADEIRNQILKMLRRFNIPIESCNGTISVLLLHNNSVNLPNKC